MPKNRRICRAKNPSDRRWQKTVGSGLCRSEHRKIWRKKNLRIPFEINKQKKNKKMDLKRNPTDHGRTNCAGEIWRKKSFGYRNENLKTSDLDSADCVAKICWIIVPAATLEEKKSVGSHVRNLCMWDLWDFCFFCYFEFVYFVDFLFRSAWCVWNLICFGYPDLKKGCTPINLIAESMSLPWAVPIETPSFWNFFVGKNRCHLV